MATTTNYGWTTPDDTDLVKDGAAAIRLLGSSIDSTTEDLNPSTTEGDMEYRSATVDTNDRLAIGTAGQVLAVNSTANAPEWVTPVVGGAANFILLNAGGTALTGAQTITVSGISAKNEIMVQVRGASSASAGSTIGIRINGDTASNYKQSGGQVSGSPAIANAYNFDDTFIYNGDMSNNAASLVNSFTIISGANASGVKVFSTTGSGTPAGGAIQTFRVGGGVWENSATITSISVFSSVGNLDAGNVFVYTTA